MNSYSGQAYSSLSMSSQASQIRQLNVARRTELWRALFFKKERTKKELSTLGSSSYDQVTVTNFIIIFLDDD